MAAFLFDKGKKAAVYQHVIINSLSFFKLYF